MVTFCAEPLPHYPACLYNCIVAGPGSDDEGPSAIVAFFYKPVHELDRRRPGGREHRRQRRMSLSCLPFPPGALQLYGGKGSSFLCSSRRLSSRPVRSSGKLRHRRREAVSFLFRKPKNNLFYLFFWRSLFLRKCRTTTTPFIRRSRCFSEIWNSKRRRRKQSLARRSSSCDRR